MRVYRGRRVRRHWHAAHWILASYLLIYAAGILASMLTTHNAATVAVNVLLLIAGGLILSALLPFGRDGAARQRR
jgi:hypothetical protein